jgi:hypothetical protein
MVGPAEEASEARMRGCRRNAGRGATAGGCGADAEAPQNHVGCGRLQ